MTAKHSPTQRRGFKAEKIACEFLQANGYTLTKKNYRTRLGEIDLIMENKNMLLFIEVRQRENPHFMSGAESVNRQKQQKIILSATHYLQQFPTFKKCRFDVISLHTHCNPIEIIWIKDAFQVQ